MSSERFLDLITGRIRYRESANCWY